jgi:nucleoside-diphosphate-sugar epimerase
MHPIILEDLDIIINNSIDWAKFENKTILITGASGLLPHYLVLTFLRVNQLNPNANITIIALVRNLEKAKLKFQEFLENPKLIFIVQDVSQPITYDKSIDYIIHAASQASPKYFNSDPVGTLKPNVIGTYNLLEFARTKNISGFLFISSGEIYGPVDESNLPITENNFGIVNSLDIRSCYAESKRMGENMCISYYSQYKIPCKIARPFHTFGPNLELNDKRVFADFVGNVLKNENIIMKSDGSATRDFCYIADATRAFLKILIEGNNGEAYNIGRGIEVSILELAHILVNIIPEKNLKVIQLIEKENINEYSKSKISRHYPNVNKIKNLNWAPIFNLEEAFRRTIMSFINKGDKN